MVDVELPEAEDVVATFRIGAGVALNAELELSVTDVRDEVANPPSIGG
jgi:hypothetical protein